MLILSTLSVLCSANGTAATILGRMLKNSTIFQKATRSTIYGIMHYSHDGDGCEFRNWPKGIRGFTSSYCFFLSYSGHRIRNSVSAIITTL